MCVCVCVCVCVSLQSAFQLRLCFLIGKLPLLLQSVQERLPLLAEEKTSPMGSIESAFSHNNDSVPSLIIQNMYKDLTLRLLMSYIYGAPILDVSRSYTTTHHSR